MATSAASCTSFDVWKGKALRSYNADTLKRASNSNEQLLVTDFMSASMRRLRKSWEIKRFRKAQNNIQILEEQ
tara:strand:- start:116 stop:334 length:219 start_codon:yes stop_codon:yes gene_type:complete